MSMQSSIDVMRQALHNMSSELLTDELRDDTQSEASFDPDFDAQSNNSVHSDGDSRSNTLMDPDHYPEDDFPLTTSDVIRMTLQIAEAMDEKFERIQRETCAVYDKQISGMKAQFKELQESLCSGYERRILQTEKVCQKLLDNQSKLMDRIALLEASNSVMSIENKIMVHTLNANFEKLSLFKRRLPIKLVQDLKDMLQDYQSKRLDRHLKRGNSNGVSMLPLISPRQVVMLLDDVQEQNSIAEKLVALPGSDAVKLPLDLSLVPRLSRPFLGVSQSMFQNYHSIRLDRNMEPGISNDVSMLPLVPPRQVIMLLEDVQEQDSNAAELVALPGSDVVEFPLDVSLVPFGVASFHDSGKVDFELNAERCLENTGERLENIGEHLQVVRGNLGWCSSYFFNVYRFTMCPRQDGIPFTIMNYFKYYGLYYVLFFIILLVVYPEKMCKIMNKNFGPALDYAGQLVVPVFDSFCYILMYFWNWLFREYFTVGLS